MMNVGGPYLVLGCGDVGFTVASRLTKRGAGVAIVDRDAPKVELLKGLGYEAFLGDFSSPEVLRKAGIEYAEAVLITARDFSMTRQALKAIKELETELRIKPVVIARVSAEPEVLEAKRLGASDALPSDQIFADSLLKAVRDVKAMAKERQLRALLRELSGGRLVIVLRNDPSPDDVASGVAMKRYAKIFGVDADVIYAGSVTQKLGRAMVRLLELELLPAEKVKFEDYAGFALVGVATYANCALPRKIMPTIVIDNHPVPLGEVRARFCDIRLAGATSALLANYLECAAIRIDEATATALTAGILASTRGFMAGATSLDFETFERLMQLANPGLLERLWSLGQGDISSVNKMIYDIR